MASDALNKRLKIMEPADQSTMYYQITGEYPFYSILTVLNFPIRIFCDCFLLPQFTYPNTDGQYANAAQDAYSYEYAGYSTAHTNEQHPYASLAAARRAALEQVCSSSLFTL